MGTIVSFKNWIQKNGRKVLFFGFVFVSFAMVFLVGGAYVLWNQEKLRVEKKLERYKLEVNDKDQLIKSRPIRIYDRNEMEIGVFYRRNFRPIRVDNLKEHHNLIWALLSSEDRDFYNHGGINYTAILRAVVVNFIKLRLSQGGSTITQQLAKLTLQLGDRNLFHKVTELFCTFYIESRFDKDTILAMYLNQIFLGEGNTGMEEASRYYFQKPAKSLTAPEAAMLVGVIPAPSVYNPVRNLGIALTRQKRVMYDMSKQTELHPDPNRLDKNFSVTIEDNLRRFQNEYKVKESVSSVDGKKLLNSEIGSKGFDRDFKINLAPDFNLEIRNYILDRFSDEDLENNEIRVITTLDFEKQKLAEAALLEGVQSVKNQLREDASKLDPTADKQALETIQRIEKTMNGALVSLHPETGEIEALVGSLKISRSFRFNRVENARRQPGSVIKALVYAMAFEKKIIHPFSTVVDEPLSIRGYSPKNWYSGYRGEMTARLSLAQSVNTVSVKLLQEIGIDAFQEKLGDILSLSPEEVEKRFPRNLSLSLGSGELTPLELVTIYATIQNGGKKIVPKRILRIEGTTSNEQIITMANAQPEPKQILDPIACAMAVNTLEAVLTQEGTMKVDWKKEEKFPMAGKTGSVQFPKEARKQWGNRKGVRDAWFGGMIPGLSTAVWIGNDQGAPFPGSGAGLSGQIWLRYSMAMRKKIPSGSLLFPPPQASFVQWDICGDDGKKLTTEPCQLPIYKQYFYPGMEPESRTKPASLVEIPNPLADEEEGVELDGPQTESEDSQFILSEPMLPKEEVLRETPEEKDTF